jgi:hypothetical protein
MGMALNVNCSEVTMQALSELLHDINLYVRHFRSMDELYREECERARQAGDVLEPINMYLVRGPDERTYNEPVGIADMAAVFTGADGDPPANMYLQVYPNNGRPRKLHCCDKHRDPYIYPLLFPHGDLGNYFIFIFIGKSKHLDDETYLRIPTWCATCSIRWRDDVAKCDALGVLCV